MVEAQQQVRELLQAVLLVGQQVLVQWEILEQHPELIRQDHRHRREILQFQVQLPVEQQVEWLKTQRRHLNLRQQELHHLRQQLREVRLAQLDVVRVLKDANTVRVKLDTMSV